MYCDRAQMIWNFNGCTRMKMKIQRWRIKRMKKNQRSKRKKKTESQLWWKSFMMEIIDGRFVCSNQKHRFTVHVRINGRFQCRTRAATLSPLKVISICERVRSVLFLSRDFLVSESMFHCILFDAYYLSSIHFFLIPLFPCALYSSENAIPAREIKKYSKQWLDWYALRHEIHLQRFFIANSLCLGLMFFFAFHKQNWEKETCTVKRNKRCT